MPINLLDMLNGQVSGPLANQAASFLGEDESAVTSALGGIFPSVLGSLIGGAKEESSASGIMDMIGGLDMGTLGNIGDLFGGGASSVNELLNSGGGILNTLLGDKMGGMVDMISKVSGLGSGSTSTLMKMATPFLMGIIGKQVAGKGVGGLMDLLVDQKDHVAKAMPSGMGSLLGLGFADMDGKADKAMSAVSGAVDNVADAAKAGVDGAANLTGNAGRVESGSGSATLGWIKWALPILAILGIGFWLMSKGGADKIPSTVGDAVEVSTDAAESAAGTVSNIANAADEMTSEVAAVFSKVDEAAMAAMDKVLFVAGSAGAQMKNYISGGFNGNSNFTFRNLNFATGSAELGNGAEVDNLASILRAYPEVNVTINGYTDNSGDATANQALSEARAASVMGRLVAQGIDINRIKSVGHGDANPIADNGTAEGRTTNRRIEITIN